MSALDVVLTPPQRERLRVHLGVPELSGIELTGEGWHRFAVLAPDRVLLLPRSHRWVPGLDREAAALPLLAAYDIPAPRLLGRITDDEFWPYPVTVISRYAARSWAAYENSADLVAVQRMLTGLGQVIADCHSIPVSQVPESIAAPTPHSPDPFEAELRHFVDYLEPGRVEKISYALAEAAGLPGTRVDRWLEVIRPCLDLAPTLTHRDLNEGQIMIGADQQVIGLIDWESAGVQHPLSDFDFGEWGFGIFAWEAEFSTLRRAFWDSYARARGGDLPDWRAVHLLMTIIGAPPPEGLATAWTRRRRQLTVANLRQVDGLV
ncbi:phosphotransferase family protein [Microlunatus sp. Gsoil 973]|uniref:phosphotransferase family protein n=1 Tax=Microlunatus sp. Gsoil 973 TaxID=2672569 RepID=UPI0018A88309|nr:phosphotransferase [Microlunatus sp. Gsoil 973]